MESSINWSSRLAQVFPEVSKIPPDITFKFSGTDDYSTRVKAHKMILAMASDVFMNMFYVVDTADRSANEIIIEDTTAPAFRVVIDAVYGVKTMKESLQGSSPHEMFSVLYLVKKYNITELVLAVKEIISAKALTEDSVLEVAHEAFEYSTTHDDESETLLLACIKFLKTKFKDMESFLQVVAENGDRMSTLHKLAVLMRDKPESPCSNCNTNPCQNGTVVDADQFRVGLEIAFNPGPSWDKWDIKSWNGEVVETVSDTKVKVKRTCNYLDGNDNIIKSGTNTYHIFSHGEFRFLHSCFMSK